MSEVKILTRGGEYLLSKKAKKVLTDQQVEKLKTIGVCMLATSSKKGIPHCVLVQPSIYENDRLIFSVIQMKTSKKNVAENQKVFLNFYNKDTDTQYKLNATVQFEDSGKLFDEIKHYEENEVGLPEGFHVHAIMIANLIDFEEVVG